MPRGQLCPLFLCKNCFSISMGSREKSSRERRNELIKQHGLDITNARDRRKIATLMQQQKKIENREIKDYEQPLKDLLN